MQGSGKQYERDDAFKAAARLHQSRYRADILRVTCDEYGNRLTERDARALLNYYAGLNVRTALRQRYPSFSKTRDGDMLRSEHIPFNLFAPLRTSDVLASKVMHGAFGIRCDAPYSIEFEYAPEPKEAYLNDATAFDAFIRCAGPQGRRLGIGIEVKYTEKAYLVGRTERTRVEDKDSSYWQVTRQSGAFIDPEYSGLGTDDMRQVWRNHLLGLSMCERNNLDDFGSITLYPRGNRHFEHAVTRYRGLLTDVAAANVLGCTYEDYVGAIDGDGEIMRWRHYLQARYLVA